jgi:NAD(P)-dependent dehydrogenase (short-subunit alcohol dehydrogenase family)
MGGEYRSKGGHVEDLDGKVAVVTGAGSGIGAALAAGFVAAGCRVMLADVERAPLEATAAALSTEDGTVEAVVTDVSDAAAVDALAVATIDRFGQVDVLCNNAGVSTFTPSSNRRSTTGGGSSTSTCGAWCTASTRSSPTCDARAPPRTS